MRAAERHPGEEALALLAGGDLPLWEHWCARWHVAGCARCAAIVDEYRRLRRETAGMGEELGEAEWARLEREMRANIRLGLAAGALVNSGGGEAEPAKRSWRWAAVAASLVFVFGAGVWLERQGAAVRQPGQASIYQPVVEAGAMGLALRTREASLELISPESSAAFKTVNWDGSAGARYFDGETGQVTIHRVEWEDSDAR